MDLPDTNPNLSFPFDTFARMHAFDFEAQVASLKDDALLVTQKLRALLTQLALLSRPNIDSNPKVVTLKWQAKKLADLEDLFTRRARLLMTAKECEVNAFLETDDHDHRHLLHWYQREEKVREACGRVFGSQEQQTNVWRLKGTWWLIQERRKTNQTVEDIETGIRAVEMDKVEGIGTLFEGLTL